MTQPTPWELAHRGQVAVASNGTTMLVLQQASAGRLFLRRAIKGVGMGPGAVDRVLPKLNELAGELLARPDIPAQELAQRLQALAGLAHVPPPVHVEWAVAELNGVRVYCNGPEVLVTTEDMTP